MGTFGEAGRIIIVDEVRAKVYCGTYRTARVYWTS
jgi:hypothetical protein